MKISKRQWIIAASVASALALGAVGGVGIWQWNEHQSGAAAFDDAVTEARTANGARNKAASALNEARLTALDRHGAAVALVGAAEPSLLADAATRDHLVTAAEELSVKAELLVDAEGQQAAPEVIRATRAPSYAAAGARAPEGQEDTRLAAAELQQRTAELTAEAKSYAAQVPIIDAALDGVTAAEVALIASAHTQGQATELPELAEQDVKDQYVAAVAALDAPGKDADLPALMGTYKQAFAAVIESGEAGARAQDPASLEPTYIRGVLVVNKTYALPSWFGDGLTGETVSAFDRMQADAAGAGHDLYISSGFRSYGSQEAIYNRYVAEDGQAEADRYSARPGHSEHQSGLTFDLNCICESFGHQADGQWVAANAHHYGFIVRYPQGQEHVTGYIWEPWHLRYLGVDVATDVYNSGLTLEQYLGVTSSYAN